MFRVKLRHREYSLCMRTADTVFLLSTLTFSGNYGDFNRVNISAGSSDMLSSLCTNV